MKKSILIALTLLLTVSNVQSQSTKKSSSNDKGPKGFSFSEGKQIKERKLSIAGSVAGTENNNLYMVGFRPKAIVIGFIPIIGMKFIFQSYNSDDMSLEKVSRANAFGKQFKRNYFLASDMLNEDPYMFTYENISNKGKESLAINYYLIDKNTMKPGPKSKLVEIPKTSRRMGRFAYVSGLGGMVTNNEEKGGRLNYLRSPDKKTFYIVSIAEDKASKKSSKSSKNKNKSISQNVSVYAFGNDMELLWEKTDKIKFDNAGSYISGVDVDNLGTVYFSVKEYQEKRKGESLKGGGRNYNYKLFYVNKDVEEVQTVKLDLDDKFVTEMSVKVLDDSIGAVCTGFYYDDKSKLRQDNVSGAFVGVVDKQTNDMLDEGFYEFDPKVNEQDVKVRNQTLFGKTKGKTDKRETEDIVLRKVFVRPDGNIVVTGERYYMYVTTTTTGTGTSRSTRTTYHYIHNDILATCITPAGNTEWTVRIPKFQHQTNGWFLSSFVPCMSGNDIYFIYNDHSDNNKNGLNGTFTSADLAGKNNVLSIVRLDADGQATKGKLTTKNDSGGMNVISTAINIDNKKVILPVMNRWARLLKYNIVDFKPAKD